MDWEEQLKLQAFLDGELPDKEARAMTERLAREPESAALLTELRQTRDALAGFEEEIRLPESREFFWSKIEREIERSERPVTEPIAVPWIARLRRFLVPVAATSLLVITGFFATRQSSSPTGVVETALADSGAFTYRDFNSGTTLVWLSYPADKELARNEEAYTVE